jgi:hypothetical protein
MNFEDSQETVSLPYTTSADPDIPYFYKIHLTFILPPRLLPSGFPTRIVYMFLISHARTIRSAHSGLLQLITLTLFAEER